MLILFIMACTNTGPQCPDGMVGIPGGLTTIGSSPTTESWHQNAHTVSLDSYCIDAYEFPNQKGTLPKSQVTWTEAKALCEAQGKRLCTSQEWERACRGEDHTRYVYGNERKSEACNTPIKGGAPGGVTPLAPAGSHSECVSPEGVYDLNGNVSEWVVGQWDGPAPSDATSSEGTWQVLRGGTMWSKTGYGQDCTSRHAHDGDSYRNIDDGFRCCQDGG